MHWTHWSDEKSAWHWLHRTLESFRSQPKERCVRTLCNFAIRMWNHIVCMLTKTGLSRLVAWAMCWRRWARVSGRVAIQMGAELVTIDMDRNLNSLLIHVDICKPEKWVRPQLSVQKIVKPFGPSYTTALRNKALKPRQCTIIQCVQNKFRKWCFLIFSSRLSFCRRPWFFILATFTPIPWYNFLR